MLMRIIRMDITDHSELIWIVVSAKTLNQRENAQFVFFANLLTVLTEDSIE